MTIEMNLEPEMPAGVSVTRGEKLHRVRGLDVQAYYWLPRKPETLVKMRDVITRLLWEDEQAAQPATGTVALQSQPAAESEADKSITQRISEVAKTSATVLLLLVTCHLSLVTARAQSIGTYTRAIALIGKLNAAMHTRPRSELSKPCRVGDRIKVEGVWYDCAPHPPFATIRIPGGGAEGLRSNSALQTPKLQTTQDRRYRTKLIDAYQQPANFDRHYVLTYWGCGTDCIMGAAIDKRNGRVVWLPFYLTEWIPDNRGQLGLSTPLGFTNRGGTLIVPNGVLVFDHETQRAPQTWQMYRGRWKRK